MEIYIIRHGKTYWNKEYKIQGWADIELTDEGRAVAVASEEGMRGIHFDAIYSSPLKRAYETACILKGDRPLEVQVDQRIKEIGFGVLEGENFSEIKNKETGKYAAFFHQPELYTAPEGAETFEALIARASDFLQEVIKKHENDERIMIVAHGAINKAMMTYFRKSPISDFWKGSLQKNCGVMIIDCTGSDQFEIKTENKLFYEA